MRLAADCIGLSFLQLDHNHDNPNDHKNAALRPHERKIIHRKSVMTDDFELCKLNS